MAYFGRVAQRIAAWKRPGMRPLTVAMVRALKLAAVEGGLDNHGRRWAPLSRAQGLGKDTKLGKPYERPETIFALESRGLIAADPEMPQKPDKPRPRFITERGRRFLEIFEKDPGMLNLDPMGDF